jgi:hypothetical protein
MRFTYELKNKDGSRKDIHTRLRYEDFAAHIRTGGWIDVTDQERVAKMGQNYDYIDYSFHTVMQLNFFVENNRNEANVWAKNEPKPVELPIVVQEEIAWLHELLDVLVRCPRPSLLSTVSNILSGRS